MSRKRIYSVAAELSRSESTNSVATQSKRARISCHFHSLSDELVLKILSFLTTSELTRCQQVCQRLYRIAGDNHVWKSAFFDSFVQSQAAIPPHNRHSSKWLEEENLDQTRSRHWKQLYKLRYNWNRGSCRISEIEISAASSEPPLSIKLRRGIIFTVDSVNGLQAWRVEGQQKFVAALNIYSRDRGSASLSIGLPTTLAVDECQDSELKNTISIAVGFDNGTFGVYQLDLSISSIMPRYFHKNTGAKITALALLGLHLITMSSLQDFTLYYFKPRTLYEDMAYLGDPAVITSLRSHTVWPPVSLSMRHTAVGIAASIIYTVPTFTLGWSVAVQEFQLNSEGTSIQYTRTASSVPRGFHSVPPSGTPVTSGMSPQLFIGNAISELSSHIPLSLPTSLSYAHPYLLTAHGNNTLTVYLVRSTRAGLAISPGQQLFGHTSAISGVHVGSRGRAVSISVRGSELRIWELDGGISGNHKALESVRVHPSPTSHSWFPIDPPTLSPDWPGGTARTRWLGFDEEKVIVHSEDETGGQILRVYDFS